MSLYYINKIAKTVVKLVYITQCWKRSVDDAAEKAIKLVQRASMYVKPCEML